MNHILSHAKFHQIRKPVPKLIRELHAQLATAPCEIKHSLICRHFKLKTKQQLEREIQAETLRLQNRGVSA